MPIRFECPHCAHHFAAKDQLAGRRMKCTHCGQELTIPTASHEESDGLDGLPTDAALQEEDAEAVDLQGRAEAGTRTAPQRPRRDKSPSAVPPKVWVIAALILVGLAAPILLMALPSGRQASKEDESAEAAEVSPTQREGSGSAAAPARSKPQDPLLALFPADQRVEVRVEYLPTGGARGLESIGPGTKVEDGTGAQFDRQQLEQLLAQQAADLGPALVKRLRRGGVDAVPAASADDTDHKAFILLVRCGTTFIVHVPSKRPEATTGSEPGRRVIDKGWFMSDGSLMNGTRTYFKPGEHDYVNIPVAPAFVVESVRLTDPHGKAVAASASPRRMISSHSGTPTGKVKSGEITWQVKNRKITGPGLVSKGIMTSNGKLRQTLAPNVKKAVQEILAALASP